MASVSNPDSSDESCRKKRKLSDGSEKKSDTPKAEDLSAHSRINSFEGFKLKDILSENGTSKLVVLDGCFDSEEDRAVILLEKLPIPTDSVEKLLTTADLAINLKAKATTEQNIINYVCYPSVQQNDIKATIIFPATEKHVEKYKHYPFCIVNETPDIYKNVVLPYLESQKFSLQWVYNILEHKSEAERIVFEDPDVEQGFVLLPDLKWDESEKDSLYLIAICHTKNLKSLRDLNASHLSLLNNIKTKCLDIIIQKYGLTPDMLRVFFHYQPSYYHMHIHFTSIKRQVPGCNFEKAHLLDTVMNNIELRPSYYQDATLTYSLKENDPLFIKIKDSAVVTS